MDIHRRENLTPRRFESIVNAIVSLIKNTEHKVVLVMLNVTKEELLYFPDVLSLTVRLNTDRPKTVFDAKSNALVPPINPQWIASIVKETYTRKEALGIVLKNKKSLYGQPGQVSKSIVKIIIRWSC